MPEDIFLKWDEEASEIVAKKNAVFSKKTPTKNSEEFGVFGITLDDDVITKSAKIYLFASEYPVLKAFPDLAGLKDFDEYNPTSLEKIMRKLRAFAREQSINNICLCQ